jgi:hypothetical protein
MSRIRIRLFSEEDVPDLVAKAGRPLAHKAAPATIIQALNIAFNGTYLCAEQERPGGKTAGSQRPNYNRTFIWVLFHGWRALTGRRFVSDPILPTMSASRTSHRLA